MSCVSSFAGGVLTLDGELIGFAEYERGVDKGLMVIVEGE